MIDLTYPKILDLFPQYRDENRFESASFLMWYLEKYYLLDPGEAVDCVCDKPGDKGIDGIFVNDDAKTITIFQSFIGKKAGKTIGDGDKLTGFAGKFNHFTSAETVGNLVASAGDGEIAGLIARLDIANKVEDYEVVGEFLTNLDSDSNADAFLRSAPHITFVGASKLKDTYISDDKDLPPRPPIAFNIKGLSLATLVIDKDKDIEAFVAPIRGRELVKMDGIANQVLFAHNLRGPMGKTAVNRAIARTIKEKGQHKVFPLFHNGITVIAKDVQLDKGLLRIGDYYVVNGCQSLTALYLNSAELSDDLRVLTKIIRVDPKTELSKQITEYSNNQNAIGARDFMANDRIQIRLQNEFERHYSGVYTLRIKTGEILGPGKEIDNEVAGLYLVAFEDKEPWTTHRSYQVFKEKYSGLFGHAHADKIVMCQVIAEAIQSALPSITKTLFAKYKLTKYMLMYILREIMEADPVGIEMIKAPEKFVRNEAERNRFRDCITTILGDTVTDLNQQVEELGDDFDYRDKLRDEKWVVHTKGEIVSIRLKLVRRGTLASLAHQWNSQTKQAKGTRQ